MSPKFFRNYNDVTNMSKLIFVFFILTLLTSSCLSSNSRLEESIATAVEDPIPSSETTSVKSIPVSSITPSAIIEGSATVNVRNSTATTKTVYTPIPDGVFVLMFYPPFVMDYDDQLWIDKSEYDNSEMMINYLQNQKLKDCIISVQGPSGFYPSDMGSISLGEIIYQVYTQNSLDKIITFYFPQNLTTSEGNVPILIVQAKSAEVNECKTEAEKVLSSLR